MKKILTIAFFLLLSVADAQTKFYLETVVAPSSISNYGPIVTFHSIWNLIPAGNGQAGMRYLIPYKCGNGLAVYLYTLNNSSLPAHSLLRRCITPPLATQTLNCILTGQIAYRAFNAGHKGFVMLRLVNPNGSVAKEIDSMVTTGLGSGANYNNRSFSYNIINLNITAGQRLLLEIGDSYQSTQTGANVGINRGNHSTAGDLPVDNTTINNTLNPWFQFSQTIKFMPLGINF